MTKNVHEDGARRSFSWMMTDYLGTYYQVAKTDKGPIMSGLATKLPAKLGPHVIT